MPDIPTSYVRLKEVDYDREILAILGRGFRRGSFHFLPPTLGVWSLWEILDSPIIKQDPNAKLGDYWRLLFVNAFRRDAVELIAKWLETGKPAIPDDDPDYMTMCDLDKAVLRWIVEEEINVDIEMIQAVNKQISLCFSGYEMFPRVAKLGTSSPYAYAGEAYGAICSIDPARYDHVIWEMPLCLTGHIMAAKAIMAGNDKVSRPYDEEHKAQVRREAIEREERGELHEWQIKCPIAFPLSDTQKKHKHLIYEYEKLVKDHKRKMGVANA